MTSTCLKRNGPLLKMLAHTTPKKRKDTLQQTAGFLLSSIVVGELIGGLVRRRGWSMMTQDGADWLKWALLQTAAASDKRLSMMWIWRWGKYQRTEDWTNMNRWQNTTLRCNVISVSLDKGRSPPTPWGGKRTCWGGGCAGDVQKPKNAEYVLKKLSGSKEVDSERRHYL